MPDAPDSKPLVHRRGADGRMEVGPDWETLIERQIREAMADGAFEDLPHQGAPLPNDDNPYAGDRALAFHVLRNAGVAPPWIEADKDARARLDAIDRLVERAARTGPASRERLRREAEALVADANRAIARVNAEAPTDRQHRQPVDVEAVLRRIDPLVHRGR